MTEKEKANFWKKVKRTPSCFLWTGARTPLGYGRFGYSGDTGYAHRAIFEDVYGKIPDDKEIDHICNNRGCVNINHLQAISHRENVLRSIRSRKTHCRSGHPLSGDNLFVNSKGYKKCLICRRLSCSRYYYKHSKQLAYV